MEFYLDNFKFKKIKDDIFLQRHFKSGGWKACEKNRYFCKIYFIILFKQKTIYFIVVHLLIIVLLIFFNVNYF